MQEYSDKRITLYDIRDELTNRYVDKRVPYHALTDEERFYLLSNETPEVNIFNLMIVFLQYTDLICEMSRN